MNETLYLPFAFSVCMSMNDCLVLVVMAVITPHTHTLNDASKSLPNSIQMMSIDLLLSLIYLLCSSLFFLTFGRSGSSYWPVGGWWVTWVAGIELKELEMKLWIKLSSHVSLAFTCFIVPPRVISDSVLWVRFASLTAKMP